MIKELTSEQEARLPVILEEWRQIGLSTEPCDPEKTIGIIKNLYTSFDWEEPEVLFFSSPMQCAEEQKRIFRNTFGKEPGKNDISYTMATVGSFDAYWLSTFKFAEEIGVKYDNKKQFDAYVDYVKNCGILFGFKKLALVSDRPSEIHFDEDERLHNENGPAVGFRDGWGVYSWHGTRVPKHWIMDKENLDPTEIIKTGNVEQRVAGSQIVGWAKMAEKLDRKIIDGDPYTDMGALVELSLDGLPEPELFLMAQCPRNGTICEGVPRVSDIDGLPIDTVLAAQAWRIGDPVSEYIHPKSRS